MQQFVSDEIFVTLIVTVKRLIVLNATGAQRGYRSIYDFCRHLSMPPPPFKINVLMATPTS